MSNTKTVMGQASNQYVAPTDITDVFSTYLYTGNGSTQTITNGIDLAGEGGIVWTKSRSDTGDHNLFFENGSNIDLVKPNKTDSASLNMGQYGVSFNSNGFSMAGLFAPDTVDIASWTFRKAPKFFDVVTYTGDGVDNRTIAHNLGVDIGTCIIKRTDSTGNWMVWHRSLPDGENLRLQSTNAQGGYSAFYEAAMTSTTFGVRTYTANTNISGATYVAYLFAHNDGDGGFGPDSDQDIIKCGSYTGNGSTDGPEIDLGFEPQWVMFKNVDAQADWALLDNMRGISTGGTDPLLMPNQSNAEITTNDYAELTATGLKIKTLNSRFNTSNNSYIYIAIRRGPLAQPESATEVFAMDTGTGTIPTYLAGFPVDMSLNKQVNAVADTRTGTRLTGTNRLVTNSTAAAASDNAFVYDYSDGWSESYANSDHQSWMWKRAPGFFDVVAYTGNSTAGRTVSHNLGVVPEMIWVKSRVYTFGFMARVNNDFYGYINSTGASFINHYADMWNSTDPTSTEITLGTYSPVNASGNPYIAYLFASLPGISKVGSYTGNGSSQTIDCGFTSGARFVLIKRTDSSGDWNFYDTERGMAAGNDSRLSLNTTDAADTSNDRVDPSSSGFAVNYIATGTSDSNISGAEYIFYAIA